jgi:hypothetical protein
MMVVVFRTTRLRKLDMIGMAIIAIRCDAANRATLDYRITRLGIDKFRYRANSADR